MDSKEPRLSKELYCMVLARMAALRGTCVRRTVGCVLADNNHRIMATGYNGVPRDWPHCLDKPCQGVNDPQGNSSRCLALHAEENAIDNCISPLIVTFAYLTDSPCSSCAVAMYDKLPALRVITYAREYADKRGLEFLSKKGSIILCHDPKVFTLSLDDMVAQYERQRLPSPSSDSKTTG